MLRTAQNENKISLHLHVRMPLQQNSQGLHVQLHHLFDGITLSSHLYFIHINLSL